MSFENPNGFVQEQEKDEILEVTIRAPKNKHKKLAPLDSDCDSPREPVKKERMAKVNKMEKQVNNLEKHVGKGSKVTLRNLGCVKFLQLTSCLEIMLSLLVIILNILFIFYGMNSGWYYFVDSLGTELEVISFGEGIIAGFFYAIFAVVFVVKLAQEDTSNAVLYVMNGLIITISIALAVGNACQMGLVDQYVPRVGEFPDAELQFIQNSETKQTAVLAVQLSSHLLILLCATGSSVAIPHIWSTSSQYIN